jgi:site-specific recombinase XerD
LPEINALFVLWQRNFLVTRREVGQIPDTTAPLVPATSKPRLLDQVRSAIRSRHCSRETEKSYVYWIRHFIFFHAKRHPSQMGAAEVTAFLSWLASERKVAASTQNQALAALLFLYRQVLDVDLPWLDGVVRAKRPVRLPTVMNEAQVRRLLAQLEGTGWLMASLLYGAGLRQRECLGLRVKDVDFAYRQLLLRSGKGGKDRVKMLPEGVVQPLQAHPGRCMCCTAEISPKAMGRYPSRTLWHASTRAA